MNSPTRLLALTLLLATPALAGTPQPEGLAVARLTRLRRSTSRDGQLIRTRYTRGLLARETQGQGVLLQLAPGISAERIRFVSAGKALEYGQQYVLRYSEAKQGQRRDAGATLAQVRGNELLIVRWTPPQGGLLPEGLAERVREAWEHPALGAPPQARVSTQGLFVRDEVAVTLDPRPAVVVTSGKYRGSSLVYRSFLIGRSQSIQVGVSEASLARLSQASDMLLQRPFLTPQGFASRVDDMLGR